MLVAAKRLQRTNEFLPIYDRFLGWLDMQTKADWHKQFSDAAPPDNLAAQSARYGLSQDAFQEEFQRGVTTLRP